LPTTADLEARWGLSARGFDGLAGGAGGEGGSESDGFEGSDSDREDSDDMEGAGLDGEAPLQPQARGKNLAPGKGKAAVASDALKASAAAPSKKGASSAAAAVAAAAVAATAAAAAAKEDALAAEAARAAAAKKGKAPSRALVAAPAAPLLAPPVPVQLSAALKGKAPAPKAAAPKAAAPKAAAPEPLRGLLDSDDEPDGDGEGRGEKEDEEEEDDGDGGGESDEDSQGDGWEGMSDDEGGGYKGGDFEAAAARAAAKRSRVAAEAEADLRLAAAEAEVYELPTNAELEEERAAPPNLGAIKRRFTDVAHVLTDFRSRRDPARPRADYVACLAQDLADYYGYNHDLVELFLGLFSPAEALLFFEANEAPPPVTIRVNTLKAKRRELSAALMARGVGLEAVGPWCKVALKVHESGVPIGATPEYLAGHYMLQSAASMVPVLALGPQPGERVVDVAAAPGGKTTHLAQLMCNGGVLVANDPKPERLASLVANCARMGVTNAVVCSVDGRKLPEKLGLASQDRVLLDAPCTGLGVIARDPAARTAKTREDVLRMAQLQVRRPPPFPLSFLLLPYSCRSNSSSPRLTC
jgi:NOL1/NOP2/sun family putative RNA methylase